jgi:hypothetical protein
MTIYDPKKWPHPKRSQKLAKTVWPQKSGFMDMQVLYRRTHWTSYEYCLNWNLFDIRISDVLSNHKSKLEFFISLKLKISHHQNLRLPSGNLT